MVPLAFLRLDEFYRNCVFPFSVWRLRIQVLKAVIYIPYIGLQHGPPLPTMLMMTMTMTMTITMIMITTHSYLNLNSGWIKPPQLCMLVINDDINIYQWPYSCWLIQYIARNRPWYSLYDLHIRITWFSLYGIRLLLFSLYGIHMPLFSYMVIHPLFWVWRCYGLLWALHCLKYHHCDVTMIWPFLFRGIRADGSETLDNALTTRMHGDCRLSIDRFFEEFNAICYTYNPWVIQ